MLHVPERNINLVSDKALADKPPSETRLTLRKGNQLPEQLLLIRKRLRLEHQLNPVPHKLQKTTLRRTLPDNLPLQLASKRIPRNPAL